MPFFEVMTLLISSICRCLGDAERALGIGMDPDPSWDMEFLNWAPQQVTRSWLRCRSRVSLVALTIIAIVMHQKDHNSVVRTSQELLFTWLGDSVTLAGGIRERRV